MTLQIEPDGRVEGEDDSLLGQVVAGEYVIKKRIGMGGMGSVYLAEDPDIGPIAVKVLHPDASMNGEVVARFIGEVRAATSIGNPHIIKFISKGALPDGRVYLAMEYLDGVTLEAYLASWGRLPLDTFLTLLCQLVSALSAAHKVTAEKGEIVHRDVKPANIFLCRSPWPEFVKVLDFGIAKFRDAHMVGGFKTKAGMIMGTPHYMSPEQKIGGVVDKRTDIYAVGLIAYEMLTGALPEVAPGTSAFRDPREVRPDLPAPLADALLWALQFHPNDRPKTLRQWLTVVSGTIDGGHEIVARTVPEYDREADIDDTTRRHVEGGGTVIPRSPWSTLGGSAGEMRAPAARRSPSRAVWIAGVAVAVVAAGVLIAIATSRGGDAQRGDVAAVTPADAARGTSVSRSPSIDAGGVAVTSPDAATAIAVVVLDAGAPAAPPPDTDSTPKPIASSPSTPDPHSAPTPSPRRPVGQGKLHVVVNPWAEVWVDGRKAPGETPFDLAISAGPHRIKIANDAHSDTKTYTIVAGRTTSIELQW